jgi:glycosyltransferase involved in cell wall biosynthesis
MDELSTRFHKSRALHPVFVTWVKELESYCEIDFSRTMATRGKGIHYLQAGDASQDLNGPVIITMPASSPRPSVAKRLAKTGLAGARRLNVRLSDALERRARMLQLRRYKKIAPHTGDLVFISWGEWWDPRFIAMVRRAHENGAKIVQVIHDLGTTVWPQFFEEVAISPAIYNAEIVPITDLVLCVSRNTKRELVAWLKANSLNVPNIEVFRLGDDLRVARSAKPKGPAFVASKLKGNDYILCVGTVEAKKNHALFYYVYKQAKARGVDLPKLVIVGRRGWGADDMYALMSKDPEVGSQFVFLHDAGDEELSWLYDHCLFTVLPSFHEGWGIPIAESLGRGVPCLCSNTSSMVEIAEGITGHFSPYSSDECLAAIQKWLEPKALGAARKRTRQYKPTSWDDSFQQIYDYIKEI